jgi:hypothetical protein
MRRDIAAIVTASLAMLLVACSDPASPSVSPSVTSTALSPSASASIEVPIERVQVFLVADTTRGFRLFPEWREVPTGSPDFVQFAVAELFAGGSAIADPDFVSLWSQSTLNAVTVDGNIATVDISEVNLNVGSEGEGRAIDQLVWTITTEDPAITSVVVTVNGQAVESLAGHIDATQPFVRAESYEVLSPITIESFNSGDTISNPITLAGFACTFEANVPYEILKDGVVVQGGATLASEACPTRSPYEVTLEPLDPGTYTIRVFELSMEDGALIAEDTKTITIE